MTSAFGYFLGILLFLVLNSTVIAQGLPPGWDYSATPSNHIISLPLASTPNINEYLLNPGDWIGVFYTNDDGQLACGGATEWLGDQNTGIISFGDDSFTGEKDGFASGEAIQYRFYSWSVQKEYNADVICKEDPGMVSCDVFISGGLSGVDSIWANGYFLVASAFSDSVCVGDEVQLFAEPSGGSGNYTYNWSSSPAGFSSTLPDPTALPIENTTYIVSVQDGDETLEASVFIEVFSGPTANAGPDITICEDSVVTVTGIHDNGSSFFWSTSGDGTFNDLNILSPEYTPGVQDIENGGVELSFTVQPISPCTENVVDMMELSIIGLPSIEVGADQIVCEDQSISASATLLNAIEIAWETSGDGTFDNPNQIETTYFPGSEDLLGGQVELTGIAQAFVPCQGESSDQFLVSFTNLPEVTAGDDQVICETEDVLLSGAIGYADSYVWETSGDGTFENNTMLETTYFPGSNDIGSGGVEISLNGYPISPCVGSFSDVLQVDIIPEPVVNAGDDETICETGNLQLNGNAVNFDEVLWSTEGDGTFSDPNILNTVYFPGNEDIANNQVQLQIAAQPLFPCTNQVVDNMLLSIVLMPDADAGEDFTIPLGEDFLTQGNANNFASILWSTSGDGTFGNPTNLETNYTPGPEDVSIAGATLNLLANPIDPCVLTVEDDLFLAIDTITSVTEHGYGKYINIFPNPSKGLFFVEIQSNTQDIIQIYVYDKIGDKIFEEVLLPAGADLFVRKEIDLGSISSGIYVLQIVVDGEKYSKKLLISDL